MALIIISGHPSSGKTHRATQLHAELCALLADPPSDDVPSRGAPPSQNPPPPPQNHHKPRPIKLQITTISDHSLCLPRSLYASAATEKTLRATLYSAVKRALGKNTVVILDSGNYIKGWRYQLYCEAKAVGVRSCVVHVGTGVEVAEEVNQGRLRAAGLETGAGVDDEREGRNDGDVAAMVPPTGGEEEAQTRHGDQRTTPPAEQLSHESTSTSASPPPQRTQPPQTPGAEPRTTPTPITTLNGPLPHDPYDPTLHTSLTTRFEEPSALTRWDTPLYTILWTDASPPTSQIHREVILGIRRDGKTLAAVRPNAATVLAPASEEGYLHVLDRVTQGVLGQVSAHQATHPDSMGGALAVAVPGSGLGRDEESGGKRGNDGGRLELQLPTQTLSMPHLQRLRRQFTALQRQQMGAQGMGGVARAADDRGGNGENRSKRIARLFVDWLNDRFESGA